VPLVATIDHKDGFTLISEDHVPYIQDNMEYVELEVYNIITHFHTGDRYVHTWVSAIAETTYNIHAGLFTGERKEVSYKVYAVVRSGKAKCYTLSVYKSECPMEAFIKIKNYVKALKDKRRGEHIPVESKAGE